MIRAVLKSFAVQCLLAAAAIIFAATAQAAPVPVAVLSNLNAPANFGDGAGWTVGKTNNARALGFQTGSDPLFLELTKISLELAGSAGTTGTPIVSLWGNNPLTDLPGAFIGSFASVTPSLSLNPVNAANVYDFAGYEPLSSNQKYWVVVQDAAPTVNRFHWNSNSTGNTPSGAVNPSAGYSYFGAASSLNNGASWSQTSVGASPFAVELHAVPEPPTVILAGLGAIVAAGHGLRRRSRRKSDLQGVPASDEATHVDCERMAFSA